MFLPKPVLLQQVCNLHEQQHIIYNAIIVTSNTSHSIRISLYSELPAVVQRGGFPSSTTPHGEALGYQTLAGATKAGPASGHGWVGGGGQAVLVIQQALQNLCGCTYTLQQERFTLKPFPRGLKINS